jgi:hypothetical protein
MKPGTGTKRAANRTILIATTLAAMAFAVGFGAAASLTISAGNTENGAGVSHTTNAIGYLSEAIVGVGIQPAALPTTVSTTMGTPTVLPAAGTTYSLNTPTAGDVIHFWRFTEATSAPVSTEVEMQFTVTTSTTTVVTAYVETQATAPGTAQTFTFSYDLGAATTTITLNSVLEISQQCPSVGTCP